MLDFFVEIFILKSLHHSSRVPFRARRSASILLMILISSAKSKMLTSSPEGSLTPLIFTSFLFSHYNSNIDFVLVIFSINKKMLFVNMYYI